VYADKILQISNDFMTVMIMAKGYGMAWRERRRGVNAHHLLRWTYLKRVRNARLELVGAEERRHYKLQATNYDG
jgi:hypothetical protein